jgi:phosphoglycolate phosphatase
MTGGTPCFNRHSVRCAIVDLDGTMVDTAGDLVAALNPALEQLGQGRVERPFIESVIGKGPEHLIRATLEYLGANPALHERCLELYRQIYRQQCGQFADVYPGVVEGLMALKESGVQLACLTNKPSEFAHLLLAQKKLDQFFAVIYGGDSFARRKPDPLPIIKTCEGLDVPSAETLVIGDSENDAYAARAAGCSVVLVNYGYSGSVPVSDLDADGVITRLDELLLADYG